MKNFLIYAVVAVATTCFSAWAFHAFAGGQTGDADSLDVESRGFNERDLEAALDEAFEDFKVTKLAKADSPEAVYAANMDASIGALSKKVDAAMKRLDGVTAGDPSAIDAENYEIPNAEQVENIVAQAILSEQERNDRERRERREKQTEERMQRMRQRTMDSLTEKLKLDGQQVAKLEVVMNDADKMRQDLMAQMRANREAGGDFDWNEMRKSFEDMGKKMDEQVIGVLRNDQRGAYDEYKSENPWGLFGGGRGMMGRGGRGGGGRGGRN
jgi:hypothetical protein